VVLGCQSGMTTFANGENTNHTPWRARICIQVGVWRGVLSRIDRSCGVCTESYLTRTRAEKKMIESCLERKPGLEKWAIFIQPPRVDQLII
jgi:hypothetical protein